MAKLTTSKFAGKEFTFADGQVKILAKPSLRISLSVLKKLKEQPDLNEDLEFQAELVSECFKMNHPDFTVDYLLDNLQSDDFITAVSFINSVDKKEEETKKK